MKLALITEVLPVVGAVPDAVPVVRLASQLAERGHDVTLLAARGPCGPTWPGVTFRICQEGRRLAGGCWRSWMRHALAAGDFDGSLSLTAQIPATILWPQQGLQMQWHAAERLRPGGWWRMLRREASPGWQWRAWYERQTLRAPQVRAVISQDQGLDELLAGLKGFAPEKRVRSWPVARPTPPAQRQAWRTHLRRMWRIAPDTPVYAFPAGEAHRDGLGTLFAAVARSEWVDGARPAPVVVIGGRVGYTHLHWLAELGLRDRVRLAGVASQTAALHAVADVLVLPTYGDPVGEAVVGALVDGTPVITTRYSVAASFLADDPRCGHLLEDPGDVAALAGALRELTEPGARAAAEVAGSALRETLDPRHQVDLLEKIWAQHGA